jgi:hypothetical protein
MQLNPDSLTKTQRYWLDHVQSAKTHQQSFSDYAKQHSLNLKAFYNYNAILRKKGLLGDASKKKSSFIAVEATTKQLPPGAKLAVVFPNDIRIEIDSDNNDLREIFNQVHSL